MSSLRQPTAGILAVFSLLFMAGCQTTSNNETQAAATENAPATSHESAQGATKTVTIPAGTEISVRLVDAVGSARHRSGDIFLATLDQPIVVDGWVVVPKGANITGRVLGAQPAGHLKTPLELVIMLNSIQVAGKTYKIETSRYSRHGQSHAKRNAAWIGGAAVGGALLGALAGGKKGALIGAGAGAGGGTAAAYATGKRDIYLPSETRLRFTLQRPLTVTKTP